MRTYTGISPQGPAGFLCEPLQTEALVPVTGDFWTVSNFLSMPGIPGHPLLEMVTQSLPHGLVAPGMTCMTQQHARPTGLSRVDRLSATIWVEEKVSSLGRPNLPLSLALARFS